MDAGGFVDIVKLHSSMRIRVIIEYREFSGKRQKAKQQIYDHLESVALSMICANRFVPCNSDKLNGQQIEFFAWLLCISIFPFVSINASTATSTLLLWKDPEKTTIR